MASAAAEHAALVERFLIDVISDGDVEALDAFLAQDGDIRTVGLDDFDGADAVGALCRGILMTADLHVTVEEIVAQEAAVAVRSTISGRQLGIPCGRSRVGSTFEIPLFAFCRIEDDRIDALTMLVDSLGLLDQLDLGGDSGTAVSTGTAQPTTENDDG